MISKKIHTSYGDLAKVTPLERKYLLNFIRRDLENENKLIQDKTAQMKNKR